jgi:trigger factor
MKTELIDVNETRKNLRVEIPIDVVNAEIERRTRDYSRRARVPGFRPGKAPVRVIKQRYRDQILQDIAHDLIPRAVGDALRACGVEAIEPPDIRDVTVEEDRPLTFTASFDTVPAFETGDYAALSLRRRPVQVGDEAVERALQRMRERVARFEPVEGRGVERGDTIVVDLERREADDRPDAHENVTVEIGSPANPPGFDDHLLGLEAGGTSTFSISYPADYEVRELANTEAGYTVKVKELKRRVLPALDDEFAKDLGEFDTLEALRARVREDLEHEARHAAEREVRADLIRQLSARVPFEVPPSLVEQELDRRLEEFARRLMDQRVDPRHAGIDWDGLRENQREAAREAVAGSLYLEEVARRERLEADERDVEREIARYAERVGRTPAAVRATLEKDGGLSSVRIGLRREKAIDFLMTHATIAEA